MISREVKSDINDSATHGLLTIISGLLNDISRTSLHNSKCGLRLVLYIVIEQRVVDLFRNEVIRKTLHAHAASVLQAGEAHESLSKIMLTSSSFMVPIAIFVRRKKDTAMKKNRILWPGQRTRSMLKRRIATLMKHCGAVQTLPNDKPPHLKSLTRQSNRHNSKGENKDDKLLLDASRPSEDKYNSHFGSEAEDEYCSTNKVYAHRSRARHSQTESESWNHGNERIRRRCEKEMSVIHTVYGFFCKALDYRTYHLTDYLPFYDSEVSWTITKWAKPLYAQIKLQLLDSFGMILFISFFHLLSWYTTELTYTKGLL